MALYTLCSAINTLFVFRRGCSVCFQRTLNTSTSNALAVLLLSGPIPQHKRESGRVDHPAFGCTSAGTAWPRIEKAGFAVCLKPSRYRRHAGYEVHIMLCQRLYRTFNKFVIACATFQLFCCTVLCTFQIIFRCYSVVSGLGAQHIGNTGLLSAIGYLK